MTDVICMGLACVDIFLKPVPEDIMNIDAARISDIGMNAGGDAVNQTVMTSRLGLKSSLLALLGDDSMGSVVLNAVKQAGADTSLIKISSETNTATAAALIGTNGERHIVSKKGSNADFSKQHLPQKLPKAKALSIASLFGMYTLERDGGLLSTLKQAKDAGTLIFADMANDKLKQRLKGIRAFLPYIDYFMPSMGDAQSLCEEKDEKKCADIFLDAGCKNVIIKKGAEGAYFKNSKKEFSVPAFKVNVKDTTGAGDTFVSAFIKAVICGKQEEDALMYACAAAALSTQFLGASTAPITHGNIEALIRL